MSSVMYSFPEVWSSVVKRFYKENTKYHTLNVSLCILLVGIIGQFGSDKPYRMPHTNTAHRQTNKKTEKKDKGKRKTEHVAGIHITHTQSQP